MINPERMLVRCYVVSQNEIEFVHIASLIQLIICIPRFPHPSDRCDSIMWNAVCFSKDKCSLVSITSPVSKYLICKLNDSVDIFSLQTNRRHWPFDYSAMDILISWNYEAILIRRSDHSEFISSALEVVMR